MKTIPERKRAGLDQIGPVDHRVSAGYRHIRMSNRRPSDIGARVAVGAHFRRAKITLPTLKFLDEEAK